MCIYRFPLLPVPNSRHSCELVEADGEWQIREQWVFNYKII